MVNSRVDLGNSKFKIQKVGVTTQAYFLAVSACAKRRLKRLKSVVARDVRHHTG
jgi:hypothetical protein